MADFTRFDDAAWDRLVSGPGSEVGKDLKRRATKVVRAAKRLAPVDTGRLRSSIVDEMGAEGDDLVARIGTDVEYAAYVELGTSRAGAQPYLRPALDAGR